MLKGQFGSNIFFQFRHSTDTNSPNCLEIVANLYRWNMTCNESVTFAYDVLTFSKFALCLKEILGKLSMITIIFLWKIDFLMCMLHSI